MKTKSTQKKSLTTAETDGGFALKLALYLVLGSLWVKVMDDSSIVMPVPVGLIIGMILVSHEHFQIDRKIEYAVLLIAAFIGFLAPFGLYLAF